ncbi:hypothetical protein [Mycolicibacterium komossense]|uniref:hypothetical protein n=1 Tax=Mycolicibacterium komossense TaxID=1779 RepID=UPI003F499490
MFVALEGADSGDAGWVEVTSDGQPAVRVSAPDLQQAQRARARIRRHDAVSVVLDITVLVAEDYRSARRGMSAAQDDAPASVRYAGTLDGLAGLIADIVVAGVADGVTLISATPDQDVRALAEQVLARIAARLHVAA